MKLGVNSSAMNQGRFIDQSRLGKHEVWEPSTDPKKPGKIVMKGDDPVAAAKRHMGALKFRTSLETEKCDDMPNGNCMIGGW